MQVIEKVFYDLEIVERLIGFCIYLLNFTFFIGLEHVPAFKAATCRRHSIAKR